MLASLSFHGRNFSHVNLFDSRLLYIIIILSSLPDLTKVSTFLPGCQGYYSNNTLLDRTVDLTREKPSNDQTFKFHNYHKICTLSASYFHDYEGFQSSWQNVADGFFALERNGTTFSVKVSC